VADAESTSLTKSFARQGIKLPIRNFNMKRPRAPEENGDDCADAKSYE
jgi:hypothetical protein